MKNPAPRLFVRSPRLLPLLFPLLVPALACDPQESPDYQGEPIASLRGSVPSAQGAPEGAEAAILWYTSGDAECQGPVLSCVHGVSLPAGNEDFSCVEACGAPSCEQESLDAWANCASSCGVIEVSTSSEFEGCTTGGIGESVALSMESFPADFELALYGPPPEEALVQASGEGPRVAMGALTALSPDAPDTYDFTQGSAAFDTIVGGVSSHALIYAADPIPADSAWGTYLGGAYEEGYHLVRYDVDVDCEETPGECTISNEMRSPEPNGLDVDLELVFAPLGELRLPL